MDESDCIAIFHRIIMPIAYEFNPELVLVSVGFDEIVGDSVSRCHLTPEAATMWIP